MIITFYGIIVIIHILAAIIGLGATFASPFIMSSAKTVTTSTYAHKVNAKVEKLAKIGSLTLLAHLIPKATKEQIQLLDSSGGTEELSESYRALSKKVAGLSAIAMAVIVVMVILMSLKPF